MVTRPLLGQFRAFSEGWFVTVSSVRTSVAVRLGIQQSPQRLRDTPATSGPSVFPRVLANEKKRRERKAAKADDELEPRPSPKANGRLHVAASNRVDAFR
jgi:hypothetical protein